jgi:hypothetical protein
MELHSRLDHVFGISRTVVVLVMVMMEPVQMRLLGRRFRAHPGWRRRLEYILAKRLRLQLPVMRFHSMVVDVLGIGKCTSLRSSMVPSFTQVSRANSILG